MKPFTIETQSIPMSNVINLKVIGELRAGVDIPGLRTSWDHYRFLKYDQPLAINLDLSEVIFMDSFGFRMIFDYLDIFTKVTPPKCQHVVEQYNAWLDSKKSLKKG